MRFEFSDVEHVVSQKTRLKDHIDKLDEDPLYYTASIDYTCDSLIDVLAQATCTLTVEFTDETVVKRDMLLYCLLPLQFDITLTDYDETLERFEACVEDLDAEYRYAISGAANARIPADALLELRDRPVTAELQIREAGDDTVWESTTANK